MKTVKGEMIKLTKKQCARLEVCLLNTTLCLFVSGFHGYCALCEKVFPACGGTLCPNDAVGRRNVEDAIIDLFEFNGYEISDYTLKHYMKEVY